MKTTDQGAASQPTLRRLPAYHALLKGQDSGQETVSCTQIAAALHLDPTQVRKDLAATGIVGRPRVGYRVPQLIGAIEGFLGWNNATDAFLAGAGSLGSALLGYRGFTEYGLSIVAAFDTDPAKVGAVVHGVRVLPLDKLRRLAGRMSIRIGIIAVPAAAAQSVADLMVEGGIRGLWSFAPVTLEVPEHVIVEEERLSSSLAVLSGKLRHRLRSEAQGGRP